MRPSRTLYLNHGLDKRNGLSIMEVLMNIREGGSVEELKDACQTVTQAVQGTGKPGKVVLEISFKRNGSDAVFVKDSIKVTVPKADTSETIFYVTDDGGLSRRDPKQPSFDDLQRIPEGA